MPAQPPVRPADWRLNLPDALASVSWAPDSRSAVVAGVEGKLWIVDASGRLVAELAGHEGGAFRAAWHPQKALIASSGQDGKVRFWDPLQPRQVNEFPAGNAWVEQLAWSPSGEWLAAGAGKVLTLWQEGPGVVRVWRDHRSTLAALAWRADGQCLAAACYGGAQVYSPAHDTLQEVLPWKTSLLSLAWSPDRRWLVAGTQDNAVQVWPQPFKLGEELAMSGYAAKVRELAWHFSGRYLATGGGESIMVWDCGGKGPANSTPRILEGHLGKVAALAYQRQGHTLASGGQDGQVMFWNAKKSVQASLQTRLGSPVTGLEWSPDDQTLLAITQDGTVNRIVPPKS
jgi:WD40 repeat protein